MKVLAGERIEIGDLVYSVERDGSLHIYKFRASGETITKEPETIASPSETTTKKVDTNPEEKETPEDIKKRSRKPPAEGPCKMCQQIRMLNRLLLCYPCWLKDKLHKDSGGEWLPGDPHPTGCGCDGPGGCSTKAQGN